MAATSKPAAIGQGSTGHSPAAPDDVGPASAGRAQPPAIRLRAMTTADLALMCRWLGAPHVQRWWHDPAELAAVSAEYLPCIEGVEPTHLLIAETAAGPVGFAQWYRWRDYPDHARSLGADPDEAGLDYLIGSPQDCGRGIGAGLIAALVRHVCERDPSVAGFVVDPEFANTASRRVLEKNGFELVAVKAIPDPTATRSGRPRSTGAGSSAGRPPGQRASSVARDSRTTVTRIWPG